MARLIITNSVSKNGIGRFPDFSSPFSRMKSCHINRMLILCRHVQCSCTMSSCSIQVYVYVCVEVCFASSGFFEAVTRQGISSGCVSVLATDKFVSI